MSKAKEAGEIILNENGAKLKDVLGAMLRLSPDAVKRVRKRSAKRKPKPKRQG